MTAEAAPIEIPTPSRFPGPETLHRLRRTRLVVGLPVGLGLLLGFWGTGALRAFGLGLAFPGGGFLAVASGSAIDVAAHALLFVVVLLAFVASVIWWWWCGNVFLPPLVWLGGAVGAALMGSHGSWSGAPVAVTILLVLVIASESIRKRKVSKADAPALERHVAALRIAPIAQSRSVSGAVGEVELSIEDLAALRFALDRGLQPVDRFDGFHFGDQWQLSATRYQVFTLGWALALANHNALPAMRGYLQEAQRRLITKTTDPRLWAYWRFENLWGNLRLGADPIAHDNIMFSGYLSKQIGLYQAITGDLRHDEPGSYTLVDGRWGPFIYDFPTIVDLLVSQYEDSSFCLWPCEPNWIYLFCNTTAGVGIRGFDAAHGTTHWSSIAERYDRMLTAEFTRPSGDMTELRSTYTGFSPPIVNGPGTNINAAIGLHALLPDRAEQIYWFSRSELLDTSGERPRLVGMERGGFDPGNLKPTPGYQLGVLLHGAREFGDDELATAVVDSITEGLETSVDRGVLTHTDVSVWGHALLLMGRIGTAGGLHDAASRGVPEEVRSGPVIADVAYPDVLVARATNDGRALFAVLHPGAGPKRVTVKVGQLERRRCYRCYAPGIDMVAEADDRGELVFEIDLTTRTELRVEPSEGVPT